jgi:hypothetical protein
VTGDEKCPPQVYVSGCEGYLSVGGVFESCDVSDGGEGLEHAAHAGAVDRMKAGNIGEAMAT